MTDYRYASGEEPRVGDTVRSLKDVPAGPRAVGDVFTVQKISPLGGGVYYREHTHGAPESFGLIARAGEPVRYQPGDVVEVTPAASFRSRFPGRYTVTEGNSPARNGVTATTPNGDGLFWDNEIKLVHRPAKTEPLVFTPPEPQVGDRVRVTFEGEVTKSFGDQGMRVDGHMLTGLDMRAAQKIEIIERAEKPLAVGDRVRYTPTNRIGTIKGVDRDSHGELFWLLLDTGLRRSSRRQYLERVS